MQRILKGLLLPLICLWAFTAQAATQPPPVAVIQSTANSMVSALKANQSQLKSNPNVVYQLVKRIVLPRVDVNLMSQMVLGRNTWKSATPAQRKQFVNQFTNLVIGTYASAFASYTDETVRVFPMRSYKPDQNRAEVNSVIVRSKGPNVPVNYRLLRRGSSWKIYDFSVEGVSLVRSFRSQFADELSKGNLNSLNQRLEAHNKKLKNA